MCGCARAARPALVGEGNGECRHQSLRSEGLLDFAVELALDHHVDQTRAEAGAAAAARRGPMALLPFEHQCQSLLGAGDRPGQVNAPAGGGQAAVLAGIGREFMHRHAQTEGGIGLEEDIGTVERDAVQERCEQCVEQLGERRRLPAAFGDEPMRVGERQHARLVFDDEVGQAAGILGGLGEQRQELREQVA